MAIKISNTTVVNDSRQLQNIASLDATTITTLKNAGIGGTTFTKKTANYTAVDKDGIIADTTAGAFTVTLPASPTVGMQVQIADGADWGTNNLTVARNGSTIEGAAEDLTLDISGAMVTLIYDGSTWEVYAQIGAVGGDVVTLTGTQTLTNKTLNGVILNDGYTEEVYNLSGTVISASNGSIQTKTLSQATTFTETLANGQSVILGITAGSFAVTWPTMTWTKVGGSGTAPNLTSTGTNWVVLWKVGGVLRGSFLGTA